MSTHPHDAESRRRFLHRSVGALLALAGLARARPLEAEGVAGTAMRRRYGGPHPTPRPGIEFYAGVDNVFDREVATFGVYGEAEDVLGEDFEDARRFIGPGAPRLFETGLRLRF